MATAMKPSKLDAQPMPSRVYTARISQYSFELLGNVYLLCTVKSGKTPPNAYLSKPFAAMALAPFREP